MTDTELDRRWRELSVRAAQRAVSPPILLTVSDEVYDKLSKHLNKISRRSKYYKDAQAALDEIKPRPVRYIYELNKMRNKCLDL